LRFHSNLVPLIFCCFLVSESILRAFVFSDWCRGLVLAHRTLTVFRVSWYIIDLTTLFRVWWLNDDWNEWICIVGLLWMNLYVGMSEQWSELDNLAQASIRKPSLLLRELPLKRRAPVLSERTSRSGEEVLPKRENATTPMFLLRALAWARERSRLSETLLPEREVGRECTRFYFLCCLYMVAICLGDLICLRHETHNVHVWDWFMDWIWWVWYGFDMRYGMVHGWGMMNFGYDLGMWFKWNGWY